MNIRRMQTDILIIGGGSAGCMAAIRAKEIAPEINICIWEKADFKYSGSIARGMDALNIVCIPNLSDPDLYLEAIQSGCKGVVDSDPSYVMAQRSYDLLKKLEKWGVRFIVDKKGNYRTLQYHVKGRFQTAMDEPDLKLILAQKVLEKNVTILNRIMGISLLKDGDQISGAVGMNTRTGELIVSQAKTVILCAGGQARFNLPNSGYLYGTFDYPGNSGDGFIMGLDAGAKLTGMEYCSSVNLIKDASMPLLAITVTRGGRVMDCFENVIMEGAVNRIDEMNKAVDEGRGPLRISLKHLPEETISEIEHILFTCERPVQERFFRNRHIDFRTHDIELWPTEVQLCGGHGMSGIRVDENAWTGIYGLYAAGDVACVPKQHLTGAFVFGEIAAENAVKVTKNINDVCVDEKKILSILNKKESRENNLDKNIDIKEFEYKVRRIIGDYIPSPKNEYKLHRWLEWSKVFKNDLEMKVKIEDGHDLARLYEIEHIIRCADCSAVAAITRKESRWGDAHFRSDYPETDNQNWQKHVLVLQGDKYENLDTTTAPVSGLNQKEIFHEN
ncbi:MAG: FAD-binding protein [Desulfobacterales bacterium]|nr:FAD-binding protein [Desulfobacterales bacterium]